MKKFLSSLIAVMMTLSLSVPVLAAEMAPICEIDSSSIKPLELTLVDRQITTRSRVEIYSFYIPDSGYYYEVPDFRGEYTDGSHITIEGTWDPTYARLNVMLKDMNAGTSTYRYIDCNEPATFTLWNHSEWGCFLKAEEKNISGTISVEVS